MWRPWSKSPARIHNSSAAAATNNFSCSTFKDIQNLCTDESNSEPQPSRKPPSVFHRVRVATSLVRSWSSSSSRQLLQQSNSYSPSQFEPHQPNNNADSTETSSDNILLRTTSEPQPLFAANSREFFEKTLTTTSQSQSQSEPEPDPNAESPETTEKTIATTSEPESDPEPNAKSPETPEPDATTSAPSITLPGSEKRIVVYFTSLRVVRPTFEDCRAVRSIIQAFRVSIDERDLSMDSGFLEELQGILGKTETKKLTLPRVFIGGRYIGGAEEIRQLHENGELKKFVEGLPVVEPGVCDACGGYSFVLCDECNGSHKVYTEKNNGFRSCTGCNENGLIRCPTCSFTILSEPSD